MAIEKDYLDRIEEIKQHDDNLSDWEKKFVYGGPEPDGRVSSPIAERPSLSAAQKKIIDRIYDEKVKGGDRVPLTEVRYKNDRLVAVKTETNTFQVVIDGEQIGSPVSQNEAIAITCWLDEVLDVLNPPKADAFGG